MKLKSKAFRKFLSGIFIISIFFSSALLSRASLITRTAVGQLGFEAAALLEKAEPPPQNPKPQIIYPAPPTPIPIVINPPPPVIDSTTDTLSLVLEKIPNDRIGIFHKEGPINLQNPVLILNSKTGGLTGVFPEDSGYYRINIGTVPNKNNGLNPKSIPVAEREIIEKSDYMKSSTLITFNDNESENLSLTGADSSLTLDTYPRKAKRYALVRSAFKVDGAWISPGEIVVATKDYGLNKGRPDKNEEFQDYRVYDSQTGALIYQFKPKDINENKFKSLDFSYTSPGTSLYGAQIYQSFSTSDIFPDLSYEEANRNWISIQADLAANVQLDINSKKHEWQERIYKQLDRAEISYIENTLNYEGLDAAKALVFGERTFIDDKAKDLDDKQFLALFNWAAAKVDLRELEDDEKSKRNALSNKEYNKKLVELQKIENSFYTSYENSRKAYDDYILEALRLKDKPESQQKVAQATNSQPSKDSSAEPKNNSSSSNKNTDKASNNSAKTNKNTKAKKSTQKKSTQNTTQIMGITIPVSVYSSSNNKKKK